MGLYVVIPLCPFFSTTSFIKIVHAYRTLSKLERVASTIRFEQYKVLDQTNHQLFWSGKLSATNNASATSVLSLISCSTGFANKCWFTRKYHKNKNDPVRLLPSASG